LNRQFGWSVALKDAAGMDSGQAVRVGEISAIADRPASHDKLVGFMTRRHAVPERQRGNLTRLAYEKSVWSNDERASLQLAESL
jgi:hypothetical protein